VNEPAPETPQATAPAVSPELPVSATTQHAVTDASLPEGTIVAESGDATAAAIVAPGKKSAMVSTADWFDDRLGVREWLWPIATHLSPKVNWWYVFGSATLIAFVMQIVTGVALAFTYVPSPNSAYQSLQWITDDATLGSVVRGIHYWGASAMMVLVFIHMCQVFAFGSFKFPRELNWLTGVLLLLLTLALAFTGQLLRWDQDAYWAVYVVSEQVARVPFIGNWLMQIIIAGESVGGNTLTRFYATHVFLLPAATMGLIGVHLYLVIRHGISEMPEPGKLVDPKTYREEYHKLMEEDGEPFWPDAAWKDVVFAVLVGAVVLILAIYPGPKHLGEVADPTNLNAHPRPDWYFQWLFAVLALMPPKMEDYLIIIGPLLAIVALFAVPFIANRGERHWGRRPWALGIISFSVIAFVILTVLAFKAPWSPDLDPGPLSPAVEARAEQAGLAKGAEIFQNDACINCHRVGDVGGDKGPNLTYIGDDLTQEQLTWRILNGGNGMPAYGETLSTSDVNAVVQFLLQQKKEHEDEDATP
ncbi:MAG TPA: cytochrome b N-terminal domain-containing protein, partial [Thermomicrobiales bacterium]|nr:cytochrome b N-terminal domain-containing protein [Thermomicrobiales bacterium]